MGGSVGESTDTRSPNTDRGRPRILVLTTTLPAVPGDGTPEFVLSLAREMSTDYDITIIAPRVRGAAPSQQFGPVRVVRFPYFLRRWEGLADGAILPNLRASRWRLIEVPFLVLTMLRHTLRHVRRERPDIVHAHWIVPAGLVAAVVRAFTRVPYIVAVHGADVYGIRNRLYRRIRDRIIRAAAAVLPVSSDLADRLQLATAGVPYDVVPMGVDTEGIDDVGSHDRPIGSFLFVGRLADKKGVDVLLQACSRVADANITIVGTGPDEHKLQELADKLAVSGRVTFLGRQSKDEVRRLMRSSFALVIPSRIGADGDQEGTPVVLAEGVAMCIPIIASALGGIAERLTHNETGILVEPASVDELAAALTHAIGQPEAMALLAKRARTSLLDELSVKTAAARYVYATARVVDRKPPFVI